MVYQCEKCEAALPPGVLSCPKCGDTFEEAVPQDAEIPNRGWQAKPEALVSPSVASTSSVYSPVTPEPREPYPDYILPDGSLPPSSSHASTAPLIPLQAPEPKKSVLHQNVGGPVLFLIVAGVLFFMFGGGALFNPPNSATQSGTASPVSSVFAPATRTIVYKVSGTASSVSITYQNPQGGSSQTEASLPWEQTLTFKDGDFVYISAQNKGESGSVTTEILVDDKPFKSTTSSGPYVIADCNGTVANP